MNTRLPAISLAFISLLCLTASSRAFFTRADGSLSQGVVFHFYESTDVKQPTKLNIIEFVVQEQKSEKEWGVVWKLKGKCSLDTLRYGESCDGLTEETAAEPLARSARYRALVSERAWLRPIGYSTVYFAFDKKGSVVTTGPR